MSVRGGSGFDDMTRPPHDYTYLRQISDYDEYHFSLCVPNPDLREARSKMTSGVDEESVIESLLKRVVGIKTIRKRNSTAYNDPPISCLEREVSTLLEMRPQGSSRGGRKYCADMVDHDDFETDDEKKRGWLRVRKPGWLAIATTPVCCDLLTLDHFDRLATLPKALLWLAITQLFDAMWFLQHDCDPPITHENIWDYDILISYPYEDETKSVGTVAKRPTFTLIGFGENIIHDLDESEEDYLSYVEYALEDDVQKLKNQIDCLIQRCYGCDQRSMGKLNVCRKIELRQEAPKEVTEFLNGNAKDLKQFWDRIGKFAAEQLEKVTSEEWDELKDLVTEVADSNGSLKTIVKDLLKSQPEEE
ncbi:hypothetical protein J4E83_009215 [Alternaria metachromatica]|uniref:uncharacterized protein n=1 Tax=Alternaria metachromatica TaxID=283354 RepID=UPI0020C47602|nr:uncharacterized protein J4E83_009215 [Alternaria metachromatica]KAI4608032.1 hypothetical protein J4E83_009215 [Alternaria metachromatica]